MANLKEAIDAIKSGDKQRAQDLLNHILQENPEDEMAWLWLAAAVRSRSEQRRCLTRVLALNPNNENAHKALARLEGTEPELSLAEPEPSSPRPESIKEPDDDSLEPKCPNCAETVLADTIICPHCGHNLLAVADDDIEEGEPLTWDEVWFSVISNPSIATFERILADPQASPKRAYHWLVLSSLAAAALGFLLQLAIEMVLEGQANPATLISLLVGVTLGPIFSVLSIAVVAMLTQLIARGMGGEGSYGQVIYIRAAYGAPLGIVIAAMTAVPIVNLLAIPLYFYALFLDLTGLRAVHRFGWGAALAAALIPAIIVGVLVGCFIFLITFYLAAASIG